MNTSRTIFQICLALIIIGALNWFLVALDPSNDLILSIFPQSQLIRSILYATIGISGLVACYIWLSYPIDVCMS
jgi:uncharacterized membrane protein YuzA (DUF378 family)